MSDDYPIDVDAGATFEEWVYYPSTDLTGCTAEMQLRRTAGASGYAFRFRSSPAEGLMVGQLASAVTLPSGRIIPAGSGYVRIRWEASQTLAMSGTYVHQLKLTWPAGANPEPDIEMPISGVVIVKPNIVR